MRQMTMKFMERFVKLLTGKERNTNVMTMGMHV